jgi:hypothetical protein
MHRLRTLRCAAVCLLSAASVRAADVALPSYFPPGTRVVIGFRARNLFNSLEAQGAVKDARASLAGLTANTPFAGFDPTQDLDEVLIATAAQGQNAPSLIVMTGRFKLPETADSGQKYRNAVVVPSRQGSGQVEAFIGSDTLLVGEAATVRAALDRSPETSRVDPALAARAAALRGRYDVWGAGSLPVGGQIAVRIPRSTERH